MGVRGLAMVRLLWQIAVLALLVVQCTASGIETEPLETGLDLGEAGDVETDDLLGEAEMEFLDKEKGDYSGTKKKLEGDSKEGVRRSNEEVQQNVCQIVLAARWQAQGGSRVPPRKGWHGRHVRDVSLGICSTNSVLDRARSPQGC